MLGLGSRAGGVLVEDGFDLWSWCSKAREWNRAAAAERGGRDLTTGGLIDGAAVVGAAVVGAAACETLVPGSSCDISLAVAKLLQQSESLDGDCSTARQLVAAAVALTSVARLGADGLLSVLPGSASCCSLSRAMSIGAARAYVLHGPATTFMHYTARRRATCNRSDARAGAQGCREGALVCSSDQLGVHLHARTLASPAWRQRAAACAPVLSWYVFLWHSNVVWATQGLAGPFA